MSFVLFGYVRGGFFCKKNVIKLKWSDTFFSFVGTLLYLFLFLLLFFNLNVCKNEQLIV